MKKKIYYLSFIKYCKSIWMTVFSTYTRTLLPLLAFVKCFVTTWLTLIIFMFIMTHMLFLANIVIFYFIMFAVVFLFRRNYCQRFVQLVLRSCTAHFLNLILYLLLKTIQTFDFFRYSLNVINFCLIHPRQTAASCIWYLILKV